MGHHTNCDNLSIMKQLEDQTFGCVVYFIEWEIQTGNFHGTTKRVQRAREKTSSVQIKEGYLRPLINPLSLVF